MNFRQKITLYLLLYIALSSAAFAQVVDIPDPNLRAAIADALNITHDAPIIQEDMNRLIHLTVNNKRIVDLSGLDTAANLAYLSVGENPVSSLTPLARLTNLRTLVLRGCQVSDISSLSSLTQLEHLLVHNNQIHDISALAGYARLVELNARENPITDLTPLAHLTTLKYLDVSRCLIRNISPLSRLVNLEVLQLNHNQIEDVRPLAALTSLYKLEIHNNRIVDHSALDSLSLDVFYYDQICDMPPLPLKPRLENRTYPSTFTRWGAPNTNLLHLPWHENIARHDLNFGASQFGLEVRDYFPKFDIAGDVDNAIQKRDQYHSINPNMVHLFDIAMRAAQINDFPKDWPYWIRDEHGDIFRERDLDGTVVTHGLIDFTHPVVQDMIVHQAITVARCGLYDGIMFDYWSDKWPVLASWDGTSSTSLIFFRTLEEEQRARANIMRRIRDATRPNFLIMGNNNRSTLPRTASYINGGFMETVVPHHDTGTALEHGLSEVEDTLLWLEQNLRTPRINALEGWAIPSESPDSPNNLRWMRAFTALSLTHSDGYVLFTEAINHTHYWYDFWDADLGQPVGEKAQVYEGRDGLYIREYTNGWAVYNHSGEAQVIRLPEEAQGVASGLVNVEHALPNLDGEMYLRVAPKNPADVNGDGVVNILDLTLVAQGFGSNEAGADVNGDGVVNVFDLVQVAGALGDGGAAPSAYSLDPSLISAADVAKWLAHAQGLGVGDANFQRGIHFLEQLLAALTPKETTLLPNYPNPFNPETWIPYRLAREAEVAITIYDTKGTPVRRLTFGNQAAGYYAERGKAAYWDGRNEDGEAVASGIYIYQFRAGDYAASRQMVIVK